MDFFFSQMATLVRPTPIPPVAGAFLYYRWCHLTGEWRRDQGDSSSCSSSVKLVTNNHDNTGNTRISLQNYNIHLNVIFFAEKNTFSKRGNCFMFPHIAYIEWGTIYSTYCVPVFQTATHVMCFLVPQGRCSNKHRKENEKWREDKRRKLKWLINMSGLNCFCVRGQTFAVGLLLPPSSHHIWQLHCCF